MKSRATRILVVASLVVLTFLSLWQYQYNRYLTVQLENNYQAAAISLDYSMTALEEQLALALVSNSTNHLNNILTETGKNISAAKSNIAHLPLGQLPMHQLDLLLNDLEIFCNGYLQGNNEELNYSQLMQYYQVVATFNDFFPEFIGDMMTGNHSWLQVQKIASQGLGEVDNPIAAKVQQLTNAWEYHSFYREIASNPQWYEIGENITKDEALEQLQTLLLDDLEEVLVISTEVVATRGTYPGYSVTIDTNLGPITGQVTGKGGKVSWFIWDKGINQEQQMITYQQADRIAKEFLHYLNEPQLQEIHREATTDYYEYTFACNSEEILCYHANIWMRIAKDDGKVVGYNCSEYLFQPVDTGLQEQVAISKEEAVAVVSPRLTNLVNNGIVVINNFRGERVTAYEVMGSIANGDNYIVYVNANTGEEELIVKKD